MSCSLGYGGQWPPLLDWTPDGTIEDYTNASYSTTGGRVEYVINIGPFTMDDIDTTDTFTCSSSMGAQPPGLPVGLGTLDDSIPVYSGESCTVGFDLQCTSFL